MTKFASAKKNTPFALCCHRCPTLPTRLPRITVISRSARSRRRFTLTLSCLQLIQGSRVDHFGKWLSLYRDNHHNNDVAFHSSEFSSRSVARHSPPPALSLSSFCNSVFILSPLDSFTICIFFLYFSFFFKHSSSFSIACPPPISLFRSSIFDSYSISTSLASTLYLHMYIWDSVLFSSLHSHLRPFKSVRWLKHLFVSWNDRTRL